MRLQNQLPIKPSFAELNANYPELKLALLDRFSGNDEVISELMVDLNNSGDVESICLGGFSWKLDEIYASYFYQTIFESIKPQLQFYLEKERMDLLKKVSASHLTILAKLQQRLDKELNATRSAVQLMMNYNKLQQAQDDALRLGQKNRNEMQNSQSKSSG